MGISDLRMQRGALYCSSFWNAGPALGAECNVISDTFPGRCYIVEKVQKPQFIHFCLYFHKELNNPKRSILTKHTLKKTKTSNCFSIKKQVNTVWCLKTKRTVSRGQRCKRNITEVWSWRCIPSRSYRGHEADEAPVRRLPSPGRRWAPSPCARYIHQTGTGPWARRQHPETSSSTSTAIDTQGTSHICKQTNK